MAIPGTSYEVTSQGGGASGYWHLVVLVGAVQAIAVQAYVPSAAWVFLLPFSPLGGAQLCLLITALLIVGLKRLAR